MGTQFFWFYDVLLIGILAGFAYKCTRQGFAAAIVSFVGSLLAFVIALSLSAPISRVMYDNLISPGVEEKITYAADNNLPENSASLAFDTLRNTDMSKAKIDGKTIDRHEFKPDSTGKITLDLSEVDLSDTGITQGDMSFFGLDAKYDFNNVNIGRVNISNSDYTKYDINDIILAKTVSNRLLQRVKSNYDLLNDNLSETIPGVSKASAGSEDLVSVLILNVLDNNSTTLESAINDHLVRPVLSTTFRILIFSILFALICIGVSFLANALNLVNDVPVIGKVNAMLGTLLGIAMAVIVSAMVCIGVSTIISLTGDNIIFLNTMTIEETFVFRHLYNIGFLNF
jgi:uncharacterized protein YjbI with pentapeptide repeats